MSHEEFFKRYGDWAPQLVHEYGTASRVTVEAMYQAFKERLIAELKTDTFGTQHYGRLVDFTKEPGP
jgi:hypothetical protein